MGTFEVYANIGQPKGKTCIVHLFSKKLSGMWPNIPAVAQRAQSVMDEVQNDGDINELFAKYTTKGRPDRNSDAPKRAARFRSTSATNFDQTGGSQKSVGALKFAPNQ